MTTRSYDATGRRATAEARRAAVLDAARELVLADGYTATTVRKVAERAGVSAETIYKTFGTKQALLKAVYDVALAGDDEPVPVGQRAELAGILALPSRPDKVRAYAGFVRRLMERLGGLLAVLTEADPELAELRATTEDERLTGVGAFVALLGVTRPGAADACWVLTSPQVYAQLTGARGWSPGRYEDWLADMLIATLT